MPKKAAAPSSSEGLQITAQQSRFHLDAVDAPASKEIWIKDLSVTIGAKEILTRAELRFKERAHYVLVGRNGTGKSTILKAIAEGRVPGIPWSTKILLLGQTRELSLEDAVGGLSVGREETVLEHVVRSDRAREDLLREAAVLGAGVEDQSDPLAAVRAYRRISHARLGKKLEEARLIATRRSGARGKKAREELNRMEEGFEQSEARVDDDLSTLDPVAVSEETKAAIDLFSEVQSNLEMVRLEGRVV
jgi:ATPase subunit of ABC transporter with duplicated ATPase domains